MIASSLGLWRLYRGSPFPKIQVLAGSTSEDRLESLSTIGQCDILVAAGGLGSLDVAIQALRATAVPCVYVLGPSEMHGRDISSVVAEAKVLAEGTQVYILERETVVIDGIRFAGASYWSSFDDWKPSFVAEVAQCPEAFDGISTTLWWQDDVNKVASEQLCRMAGVCVPSEAERAHVLHPVVAYIEHQKTTVWLQDVLATKFDGPTVLVTSSAPTRRDLAKCKGYCVDDVTASHWPTRQNVRRSVRLHATTNDDGALLQKYKDAIDLWVHGGGVANSDVIVEGVRLVCRSGHLLADDPDAWVEQTLQRALATLPKPARRKAGLTEIAGDKMVIEHPPAIDLEFGFIRPLSVKLLPAAEEMARRETAIQNILPHLMNKSPTLRACVRRVIHDELVEIDDLSMFAFQTEGELLSLPADSRRRFVTTFADAAPQGYPTDVRGGHQYDYYARTDVMQQRVDEVRSIPKRATATLMRWVDSAHAVSRMLAARGIEALFARPSYDALRLLHGSADTVRVVLKISDVDLDSLRTSVANEYAREHGTSADVRFFSIASPECLHWTLLDTARIREIAENVVVAFDVTA
jgi:hypothetical protein